MSIPLPFGNNNITVYSYESFSYTISNPDSNLYTLSTTKSSGIPPSYLTNNANQSITFAATSNAMFPGNQTFTVSADPSGGTSVNSVTIAAGRFLDPSGNSFVGSNYTFFAKEAISPIQLVAPFNLASPVTSTPALPPGLGFSAISGSNVSIVGTPSITVPQSNYLIIGRATTSSKTVSSTISMVISNERIQTNLDGGSIVSGMQIGTPISPRTLTAKGNGTIRYTWPSFPDGIVATDNSGNVKTSGFLPSDPSYTMIITGTPTLTAANFFKNAGYSNGLTQSILVERVNPLPLISNTVDLTFRFGETVLFDTASNPRLYTGVALDPTAIYYRALTYFTSNVGISSIFSPDLRSDLSLAFNGVDRAYLTGTPISAGSASYTIRAINSNGVTRDTTTTIEIVNDSVSFISPPTPAVDVCYNFVLSRPIDVSLNGYYPTPIQFSASAASGRTIQWSAPALTGTGLSLSATSGPTVTLQGTPSNITSLSTLAVTASATGTPATATRNTTFAILNDQFTFDSIGNLGWIQNKAISAVQIRATTLSGRQVSSYTASGVPAGVSLSPTGLLTGTPTTFGSGSFTVTASTGFANGSQVFSYNTISDNLIVVMANTIETVSTTFSGVDFRALTYSGKEGTINAQPVTSRGPYQGINFDVSFSSGNFLQGDFSSISYLLPKYRFAATGTAGAYTTESPVDVVVNNAPTNAKHIIGVDSVTSPVPGVSPTTTIVKLIRSTTPSVSLGSGLGYSYLGQGLSWDTITPSNVIDRLSNVVYGVQDVAQNGDVLVAVAGSNMIRSSDGGASWEDIASSNIQALDVSGGLSTLWPPYTPYYPPSPLFGCIANDGTSNWVAIAIGTTGGGTPYNVLRQSSDNGMTWTDTSTNFFTNITAGSKLYYNNGRFFAVEGTPPFTLPTSTPPSTTSLTYASASNLGVWTPVSSISGVVNDLTFSNNTALAVGSNGGYSSTDNGTTWTALPTSPIVISGPAEINSAKYAYGKWVVSGKDLNGDMAISVSSDLTTWTPFIALPPNSTVTASTEDGAAWLFAQGAGTGGISLIWDSNGNLTPSAAGWGATDFPALGSKRIISTLVSNGTPTLTISIPYDPSDISIQAPTQTSYINWQFVPISPITVRATTGTSNEFLYYYASGLPDGLSFVNDASGLLATITGTSVKYSDAVQRVLLYIVRGSNVAATSLGMRTILPTVQKVQSGAGAWTYSLRQYVEVNAALNSRDTKVTPSNEYRLGEFTRPEPPDVITAVFKDCDKC